MHANSNLRNDLCHKGGWKAWKWKHGENTSAYVRLMGASSFQQAALQRCICSNYSPTYPPTNLRDYIRVTFTNTDSGSEKTWTFISTGLVIVTWGAHFSPCSFSSTRAHGAQLPVLWEIHSEKLINTCYFCTTPKLDLFIPCLNSPGCALWAQPLCGSAG